MQNYGFTGFFAAAGAVSSATNSQSAWVGQVVRELGRSQGKEFIFDVAKWTLLGAFLGTILAILACLIFSRIGWYEMRWRFAGWLRWSIYVPMVIVSLILFGLAGFWSGVIRGTERVLTKSQLATDVFPKIAGVVADGMAWVQIYATLPGAPNTNEVSLKLDGFREGKWELHASQFLKQLDEFQEDKIQDAIARLEQTALERTPQLKGGIGEKLLHQLLSGLGRALAEKKVAGELKSWGADKVYLAIREQLTVKAAMAGNPETISREEISTFIVHDGIVPGIMKPVRATARSQQLPLVIIAVLVIVVPPVCIRLARILFGGAPPPEPPKSS